MDPYEDIKREPNDNEYRLTTIVHSSRQENPHSPECEDPHCESPGASYMVPRSDSPPPSTLMQPPPLLPPPPPPGPKSHRLYSNNGQVVHILHSNGTVLQTNSKLIQSGGVRGEGSHFSNQTTHTTTVPIIIKMRERSEPSQRCSGNGAMLGVEIKQERGAEEPSSSIPDLEFDGTTVLCRVCGDKASGFHYGVHSCEGCKGFFRRSIQQKIQYRPCTKNQQCAILRINRNRCQYCRLKKCIAVGMSRDAVRFGRVPKREKARILAAMQQSTNSRSHEKQMSQELEDEHRLISTVIQAHLETCEFTRDKVGPMLVRAREQPSYSPPTLACPLNPNPVPLTGQQELLNDFSKRFSPCIRGVVEFAKNIPGFSLLAQEDQVTLLKAGVFEVLLVRLACLFDAQNNTMVCLNGQVLRRESIQNSSNARFLMDSMFDFADRLNSMNLTDEVIGLFCSIVIVAADRPGLRNVELIEMLHTKLKNGLQRVLNQHYPNQHIDLMDELVKKVPDLRTLNTLHSEKLLAFKMTEQKEQEQGSCGFWGVTPTHEQQNQYVVSQSNTDEVTDGQGMTTSPTWSSSSDVTMEDVKSPVGSVSSTESMCEEYKKVSTHASSAPLLAATLAGVRHRANSNSSGEEDLNPCTTTTTSQLITHNGLVITPINGSRIQRQVVHRLRKLDSPTDSGIESGTDHRNEHRNNVISSAPTSLCSSPRSDDHLDYYPSNGSHIVEDMPVLKRVLQAPPLYDTNSLMDEAYKPHKKFRALRKESAEAEPMVIITKSNQSLSSTHSTLAKSLMEGPRMTAEQLKRTDIIHSYIMRGSAPKEYGSKTNGVTITQCPYKMETSTNGSHHPRLEQTWIKSERMSPAPSQSSQQYFSNGTSVIKSMRRSSPPVQTSSPAASPTYILGPKTSVSPHTTTQEYSRVYYHRQASPIPSSSSPGAKMSPASSVPSPTHSPKMMLQVDIGQPLNLSKKSPSPSPTPTPILSLSRGGSPAITHSMQVTLEA